LNLLEGKIIETLSDLGIGSNFRNGTSITQERRARTDQWGYIKFEAFFTAKK
jgi:hypothetical protein